MLAARTASSAGTVAVDLSGASFLDSSGVGVLIGARKRLAAADRRLVLRSPSPEARGVIAILGGPRARRAALRGVVSIASTSILVNLPLKYLARRQRPATRRSDRPLPISMPGSFSFPSGHSASAFAFATGVAMENPQLLLPILPLAAGVAYSRVHLRVHYPFDVLAGAAIGTGMGLASGPLIRHARRAWDGLGPVPDRQRPQTNRHGRSRPRRTSRAERALCPLRATLLAYGIERAAMTCCW